MLTDSASVLEEYARRVDLATAETSEHEAGAVLASCQTALDEEADVLAQWGNTLDLLSQLQDEDVADVRASGTKSRTWFVKLTRA